MTEEELANIGGWYNVNYDQVNYCPNCGNNDRNEVSRQFFASFFDLDGWTKFRCKKCNHYFKIGKNGYEVDLGPAD